MIGSTSQSSRGTHNSKRSQTSREEAKLAVKKDEEGGLEKTEFGQNSVGKRRVGIQISTLCELLDCKEEELYDSDFSDSSFDPAIEMMENSSADSNSVQCIITNIV